MLLISELLWEQLLDAFAQERRSVERVAYLDGVRSGSTGVVTTITIPDADLRPGNYQLTTDAMSQVGRAARSHGLVRLAQVHTHPNRWVEHSSVDDANAYSHRPDAISIVLAHHARHRPTPTQDAGVHVRDRGQWHRLGLAASDDHIRLVPSLIDFRPTEPTRPRRWWRPW